MNGKTKLSTKYINQAACYAIPLSVSPVRGLCQLCLLTELRIRNPEHPEINACQFAER